MNSSRFTAPGGVALFAPDWVKETFSPGVAKGGHYGGGRAMRYLEWVHDPDPNDTTYNVEYAFLLKTGAYDVRAVHDHHIEGIFPRQTWVDLIRQSGFEPSALQDPLETSRILFIGRNY